MKVKTIMLYQSAFYLNKSSKVSQNFSACSSVLHSSICPCPWKFACYSSLADVLQQRPAVGVNTEVSPWHSNPEYGWGKNGSREYNHFAKPPSLIYWEAYIKV